MSLGSSEPSLGRGRSLAEPAFPDDDGSPDPDVRGLLADRAVDPLRLARALRGVRVLTTVVAVAEEIDEAGGDKSSHMAVVSMVNERGELGLLAFSGVDSVTAWNPEARPVPTLGAEAAEAAIEADAAALVIDVAGPHRVAITGLALKVMADLLDMSVVRPRVQAALAGLTADGWVEVEVLDVRAQSADMDVLVEVVVREGAHPDGRTMADLAVQAARVIAERADLTRLVPGGIGVTAR